MHGVGARGHIPYCLPAGAKLGDVVEKVTAAARANPQLANQRADIFVMSVLAAAYPCK
jgi:hypothetical protein